MVDRLGSQLNEAVSMPEFLQDRAALGVRTIDARELVLEQEIKDQFRVTAIGLVPGTRPLSNFGGVADPDFVLEFKEQILKPLAVAAGFQADDYRPLERRIKRTQRINL